MIEYCCGDIVIVPYPAKDNIGVIAQIDNGEIALVELSTCWEIFRLEDVSLHARQFRASEIVQQGPLRGTVINPGVICTLQPIGYVTTDTGTELPCNWSGRAVGATDLVYKSNPAVRNAPLSTLQDCNDYKVDDLLIRDDWLGYITKVTRKPRLKLDGGAVIEFVDGSDESGRVRPGDLGLVPMDAAAKVQVLEGQLIPDMPLYRATVLECQAYGITVNWRHRRPGSQSVVPAALLTLDETPETDITSYQQWRACNNPHKSASWYDITTTHSGETTQVGMRYRFSDRDAACARYNGFGSDGKSYKTPKARTNGYDLDLLDVTSYRTQVTVLWEDASISQVARVDLQLVDEDAGSVILPGTVVYSKHRESLNDTLNGTAPEWVGIAQSSRQNPSTVSVRICPAAHLHFIPSIPGHAPIPGNEYLLQAIIGNATGEIVDVPLDELETSDAFCKQRGDIVTILPGALQADETTGVTWIGTIVDVDLNGNLLVQLNAAQPVRRLMLRHEQVIFAHRPAKPTVETPLKHAFDTLVQEATTWRNAHSQDGQDNPIHDIAVGLGCCAKEKDAYDQFEVDVEAALSNFEATGELSYLSDDEDAGAEPDNNDLLDPIVPLDARWKEVDDEMQEEQAERNAPSHQMAMASLPTYALLDAVPADHAFKADPATELNMTRIHKEHLMFQQPEAIPSGIFVRSFESRLDLWRVLFIGAQDTPYANTPLIIDFSLPPAFPQKPPKAFFHSWNAQFKHGFPGSINPNLYQTGYVCLSLLGTWGDTWMPARNTLLQVVVSVLGLVLIKEPMSNEPGYEKPSAHTDATRVAFHEEITIQCLKYAAMTGEALQKQQLLKGMLGLEDILSTLYRDGKHSLLPSLEQRVSDLVKSDRPGQKIDGLTVLSEAGRKEALQQGQRFTTILLRDQSDAHQSTEL